MDIILYLVNLIQQLYEQNPWLIQFICKYIPLKQWTFDDSKSPKYQKFKIDELPTIQPYSQDWTYKDLIPYWEKRYGKLVKPVSHRRELESLGTVLFESFCGSGDNFEKVIFISKQARIIGNTGWAHIIVRGIKRENLFYDNEDYDSFSVPCRCSAIAGRNHRQRKPVCSAGF